MTKELFKSLTGVPAGLLNFSPGKTSVKIGRRTFLQAKRALKLAGELFSGQNERQNWPENFSPGKTSVKTGQRTFLQVSPPSGKGENDKNNILTINRDNKPFDS